VTTHDFAEVLGVLGGLLGTGGSILLTIPLFHLLRAREAIEDLEIALGQPSISGQESKDVETSLYDLKVHVRTNRRIAINFGLAGLIILILAMLSLILQAVQLYA
jgi:hypothetical protein